MYYNKVEICGIDTSKLKVLKEKEKMELLRKAQSGDKKARDDLFMGNIRLVLSVIQKFANRGENPDDLFQIGCIGLLKAIDRFEPDKYDVMFSSYAVPLISGELKRFLRDDSPIRVSRSMRDTAYHAMQAKEQLISETGKEPTIEEIAQRIGKKKSEISVALEAIVAPVSFYEPVYSNGGDTIFLMDQLGTDETSGDWIDEISIKESIKNLPKREKIILSMRFMKGMTQTEVAEEIGISQAQVSRLEKNAIKTIKGGD